LNLRGGGAELERGVGKSPEKDRDSTIPNARANNIKKDGIKPKT